MEQLFALDGSLLSKPVYVTMPTNLSLNTLPNGLVGFNLEAGLVHVIPSEGKKEITMKFGRLLKKADYVESIILEKSTEFSSLCRAFNSKLKFTTTSEEVLDVYKRGPHSCMKGSKSVEVYATEDVAVAYLEDGDKVIARTVVCTNKDLGLQFTKCYGFEEPLIYILLKEGYKEGTIADCKLLKIEEEDNYLMPYLDTTGSVDDHGEFFVVSEYGEYEACNTDGLLIKTHTCDQCGHSTSDGDDMHYSHHTDEQLCETCYDDVHVYIDGNTYHINSSEIQELKDGDYVLVDDACFVEERNEWHERDNCKYNSYSEEYILASDLE